MREMGDLVGTQRTAAAGMVGPSEDSRLEEGAIQNQLRAAGEQVEQARLAFRPDEFVFLFDGHPRHTPALGGHRVTGAGQFLFFNEQLLSRGFPLRGGYDCRCFDFLLALWFFVLSHGYLLVHGSDFSYCGTCGQTYERSGRKFRPSTSCPRRSRSLQLRYIPDT